MYGGAQAAASRNAPLARGKAACHRQAHRARVPPCPAHRPSAPLAGQHPAKLPPAGAAALQPPSSAGFSSGPAFPGGRKGHAGVSPPASPFTSAATTSSAVTPSSSVTLRRRSGRKGALQSRQVWVLTEICSELQVPLGLWLCSAPDQRPARGGQGRVRSSCEWHAWLRHVRRHPAEDPTRQHRWAASARPGPLRPF